MIAYRIIYKFVEKIRVDPEAPKGGILWENMFLEILQNSQEYVCAIISFIIEFAGFSLQLH